ncbi:MAG: beta-glucosidase [Phototrophicales bacterium]|nr:MAG: beta-glucosidase [Phototrophicales bacterium]
MFYEIGQTDRPEPPEIARGAQETQPPVTASALYRNGRLPAEARVIDLMARMTLEEKIGQMTLVEKNSLVPGDITAEYLGGVLSGGGGYPSSGNTPENWAAMVNSYQDEALATRLGIPIIYGVDAVHGHSNVYGATIFPHNIGLGATRNAELVREICRLTALETSATGIYWDYAPVLAVAQDIRWGRTYESYSENTDLVTLLSTACLLGLQGEDLADPTTVLGTPKHFVGDGGAEWGTSTTGDYIIDQGFMNADEATLREIHLAPYISAIENGALSIMVSYSGWNGTRMHGNRYLITDVLKGELGFEGFVVSDWAGVDMVAPDYYEAVVTAINAGIDMNMVPYDYIRFIETVKRAVNNGDISPARIDDAVYRILLVKFRLGLFEHPYANPDNLSLIGAEEHRAVARQAVAESAVLLKNENDVLPIAPEVSTVLVAGIGADDIGMQCGGWTIEWQGGMGDITVGTSILEGLVAAAPENTTVLYDPTGEFADRTEKAEIGIVVVGERPYAEGRGDNGELALLPEDLAAIEALRPKVEQLVVVILSGRPLIITDYIEDWDAVVAAWLPGTEGAGIADVLFGYAPFTGQLSFTWPASVDQLPQVSATEPLFPFGYGLTTTAQYE